jgi:hypothetical protein
MIDPTILATTTTTIIIIIKVLPIVRHCLIMIGSGNSDDKIVRNNKRNIQGACFGKGLFGTSSMIRYSQNDHKSSVERRRKKER